MLDFVRIAQRRKPKLKVVEIYPKFIVNPDTEDLMVRGGDFYAVWDNDTGLWSTKEGTVIRLIDQMIDDYISKLGEDEEFAIPMYMWDCDSGSIDRFHKFCQKQMRDNFKPLDEKIIFSNTAVQKLDYVSKRLPYPLKEGPIDSYEELISTLYLQAERDKLEWAIGAIISGDAKHIQKFEVLYGSAGTGKSTVLNIIEMLFNGYISTFNAKELASANNAYALESFKTNPLVSIQHDGDLSRIEDNTKLNSIVSHEMMEVNAKYTKLYMARFNTFLFMGTNKPVKITEAKSGIIRRLIDVSPSGKKLSYKRYSSLMKKIPFELGGIAFHCLKKYEEMGENYYDSYIPVSMISATNDFYDFVQHYYDEFVAKDMVTLTEAWQKYKEYCDFAHAFQLPLRVMRVEMQNYFDSFYDRYEIDGKRIRSVYVGFKKSKFESKPTEKEDDELPDWLKLDKTESILDDILSEWPAQYPKDDGSPAKSWSNVVTKLKNLDTHKLHWLKPPEDQSILMIDFDLKDETGKKDKDLNLKAAARWPKTYAELSNSGGGVHLYYFYDGDLSALSHMYDTNIEIKPYDGASGSSIRRRLTACNDISIAVLSSGLPTKGDKKVVSRDTVKNEKVLRSMIIKNLNKEYHADTTSSIDFIKFLLDEAYKSGIGYDVSDLQQQVILFAMNSTNQSDRCVKTVASMHFKSDEPTPVDTDILPDDDRPVFFDLEIYPNLFLIAWKYEYAENCVPMLNPKAWEIEELFKYKLIGFNNRDYDNHMLWAGASGYSVEQLYNLSQLIISGNDKRSGKFGEAYNLSYTDVYDFCTEKMSLKKWEIRLGIHHEEMGIPWDQPVPEDMIPKVVEYCMNDVMATEAVFHARQEDFIARKIQVDLVSLLHGDSIKVTVNDTTNTLSKRIIFGSNKEPQSEFNYRDLSLPVGSDQYEEYLEKFGSDYRFRVFDADGLPQYRDYIPGEVLPDGWSILPFFPGYEFVDGVSTYLGEIIGEGGRVYSERGLWLNVWDGDALSMHPHSVISECLFGPRYTKIFADIVAARVAIKHKDFNTAATLLNGVLKTYLTDETAPGLAQALKIIINSIYGLTKAGFKNEFRDPRNVDNIVAKRGALFMTLLKREVQRLGYSVCHIKTDSIKIPEADDKIKEFVVRFGREFGYEFETEYEFIKFALFNDAAYIGRTTEGEWVTKADQFKKEKQPYLFKTLFSHEPYTFDDFCETKSVSKGALYLDFNEDLGDEVDGLYEKERKKLERIIDKTAKTDPVIAASRDALYSVLDYVSIDEAMEITDQFEQSVDKRLQAYPEIIKQIDICVDLKREVPKHHNYQFIGRVGRFTPVKEGCGGGKLYRFDNGKYYAVGGTSGYRWMESEYLKKYGKTNIVDERYYMGLVDTALDDISDVTNGNADWFLESDELFMNVPEGPEEVPFN